MQTLYFEAQTLYFEAQTLNIDSEKPKQQVGNQSFPLAVQTSRPWALSNPLL
jgi:hypothetical protein